MSRALPFRPEGVIPATLLGLDRTLEIDIAATRKHLRAVADVKGLSAITVNGHASEVHACTLDEQQLILDLAMDECGATLPIVCGVYADGSREAARVGRMAAEAGAAALLVFPSHVWGMGGEEKPEMAIAHYQSIASVTDLPLIAFVYPQNTGLMLRFDTLLKLFDSVPTICAIKDWCNDPHLHERHIRTYQNLSRPVNVLTTHSSWLMASLSMGCKGLISGAGSVVADMQVRMFNAIRRGDLVTAQRINDTYHIMARAFYAAPFTDMHNRMKECLTLLGQFPESFVRPPLTKLGLDEINQLKDALIQAGLYPGVAWQSDPNNIPGSGMMV